MSFPFQLGDFEVPAINECLDDDLDGEDDGLDSDDELYILTTSINQFVIWKTPAFLVMFIDDI